MNKNRNEILKYEHPQWLALNKDALNGNILVTGSIGSGKSQGTILPYLDQILSNFEITPSLLAIDPKNTFIPKAIEIIKRHGLEDRLLHLHLGGKITFNPIYHHKPLERSRFLDIAQMVRAAAVNFMGKSFDTPFWEISAFNLVKNALVYCAAVKGYYTLKDLYTVMIQASEGALEKDLCEALLDPKFSDEEKYNISCAQHYFTAEYKQLDEKVRTGILATSTSFLNQFQEYQASRIFCPQKKDIAIQTMDQLIDEGKLLLFDVSSPALARSMGTFIKLHYQQSILDRLNDKSRDLKRSALLIMDEYQDVVSTGSGATLGDERFLAKSREANAITIAASQSLTSLENSVGSDKAAKELFQNFRTRILAHSSDLATIRSFQELAGQYDREKKSRSISELSQHTRRNIMLGGFDLTDATLSESVNTSEQKEYLVTGKDFSRLSSFEAFACVYDGVETIFTKLFLKPYFLKDKSTPHKSLLTQLKALAASLILFLGISTNAHAFPSICSVLKTDQWKDVLEFNWSWALCGWPIPRPCANISYYIPTHLIEVVSQPKQTFFKGLPPVELQLATTPDVLAFGAEEDNGTYSFHAHVIQTPLLNIPFRLLPCWGFSPIENFCFNAMSEHIPTHWKTGTKDLTQPSFLAWSLSPQACLLKGAAESFVGSQDSSFYPTVPSCSVTMDWLPTHPPSNHPVCTGWGIHFPRYGTVVSSDQTTASLMIASRIKSLGTEVFKTVPNSADEKWQMLIPQASSGFKLGQNIGILQLGKGVTEIGRILNAQPNNYLYAIWKKVECSSELPLIPGFYLAIELMGGICQGLEGI